MSIAERVLLEWRFDPALAVVLVTAAALYLAGARRTRRWPGRRTAAYAGGLAVLAAAGMSGLDAGGEELLSIHMVQHVLLLVAAPILILLGRPVSLALRALPREPARALAAVLRGRAAAVLAHPLTGLTVLTGVVLASHAPVFYDAALRSPALHAAEHAAYLWAGLLFWLAPIGAEPLRAPSSPLVRSLSVLLAMPSMALVGVALLTAGTVVYPAYEATAAAWGTTALADQHAGGAIMWIGGGAVYLLLAVAVAIAALLREERRAVAREGRVDRSRAAGVEQAVLTWGSPGPPRQDSRRGSEPRAGSGAGAVP